MIAVLDYGIGNLRSAEKALQHVGADAALTADPDVAAAADGVVLPGVGSFGRCMEALRASGLDAVALSALDAGKPFLGICVGMQMLYEGSDESPGVAGLGVLPGTIRLLPAGVKRPQMQWNRLDVRPGAGRWLRSEDGTGEQWVYFVHSYAAPAGPDVVATCDYGGPVTAAVERGPLWATQFHPEKSGAAGLAILRAFAERVSVGDLSGASR
ncbi:imidazole glycerol phosphate synthase subunit HisH [Acidiferrimicrobium sp. IK]|uniref:imidazole glycerol phosphate synthase subunit HisH n=1 Tax=Acidiferrimicrobium sp. IK TaxID=2871700 RepID=UPI0021CB99DA|nr:imidazole glycerol phosphate synthase subunit HisH [Acidiferrimicrobium sp. IK]MCU4183627.1 imidazole glycerol phosphate synthase subunit HisH [Acidiferrimicrobium sp. IK]